MQISDMFFQKFSHTSNLKINVLKQKNNLLLEDLRKLKGKNEKSVEGLRNDFNRLQKNYIFKDASEKNLKKNFEVLQKKKEALEKQLYTGQ